MDSDKDNINNNDVIDLRVIGVNLWKKRKSVCITMLITAVVASALILMVPRAYNCEVSLAPEDESSSLSNSSLGSIASAMGFGNLMMQSSDAIYPLLYPDLFRSDYFMAGLFTIGVESLDGSIKTDYYHYLKSYQKTAPWMPVVYFLMRVVKLEFLKKDVVNPNLANADEVNPFMLTRKQKSLVAKAKKNIKCNVDRKTSVITISVTAQDPLIAASLADSIRERLQVFITDYRTNKAREDFEYYNGLLADAEAEYMVSVNAYSKFCDTHKGQLSQSSIAKRQILENDMELKFNTFNALATQVQTIKAKIQERTPAFTILNHATVPIKAATPKRQRFVLAMMFLAFCVRLFMVVYDEFVRK